ncbi:hypothetical protein ACFU99_32380 [Streptomyces sp. NPDC057654]|uniref:hypothetical protein n=1 Tax=Streptomyces sp. NPDC057654 TaxID=3346196 RepID=UPI0036C68E02
MPEPLSPEREAAIRALSDSEHRTVLTMDAALADLLAEVEWLRRQHDAFKTSARTAAGALRTRLSAAEAEQHNGRAAGLREAANMLSASIPDPVDEIEEHINDALAAMATQLHGLADTAEQGGGDR